MYTFLQILIYYYIRWSLFVKAILSVEILLWIVCVSGYSVDCFRKNPERNISVIIHCLVKLFNSLVQLFNTSIK